MVMWATDLINGLRVVRGARLSHMLCTVRNGSSSTHSARLLQDDTQRSDLMMAKGGERIVWRGTATR